MCTPEVGLAPCYAANTAIVYDLHFLKYRRVYRHEFLVYWFSQPKVSPHIHLEISLRWLCQLSCAGARCPVPKFSQ